MELDVPVDSQHLDGVAPSSTSQPASAKDGGKDPERFYCPYPGCNRSFAELWRLKVHFRAPPDIRGSGKERGHGTELTHCPKCGKTLKPGKHHVGCSGSKTNARQANKRSRAAGEADPPDDALATSPTAKQIKMVEVDADPLGSSWQDFARSHGSQALHQVGLSASMKQEQSEWPAAIQPGIIYGPNGTATACWLPGQVNGFVPQLQAQGYPQPHYAAELQFASSAHGYPQQVPAGFPGLPGYSQPALPGLSEAGQVLTLPPGGTLQQLSGVPGAHPGGISGLNPVLFAQQQQQQQQQPHEAASSLMPSLHADHPHPAGQQQQQQSQQLGPSGPGHHLSQQQVQAHSQLQQQQHQQQQPQQPSPHPPAANGTCDTGQEHLQQQQQGGEQGGGGGGTTGSGGPGPSGIDGVAALGPRGASDSPAAAASQPPLLLPSKSTNSGDSLGSVFGDVEEFTRDFGRIPSPPPLPADFHSASSGTGGMLFNFAQFGQKLPRSQSHTRLDKSLSAVGLSVDPSLDPDLLYDHTDDGDLMQLLFGVPDELPTMATIHLHKWSNEEEGEAADEAGRAGGPASSSFPQDAPPAHPQQAQQRDQGPGQGESNVHTASTQTNGLGERTSSQTAGMGTPQPEQSQPAAPGDQPGQGVPQVQQTLQQQQQSGHPNGLLNGKVEAALGGSDPHHLHGNGVESYLAHAGPGSGGASVGTSGGGGGKVAALAHLVNGVTAPSSSHVADEHHRDHLLDAETFRLLQSCD